MSNYLLGIDNGGTITKAAIFDLQGKEIAVAGCKTKLYIPEPGFTERDMNELWDSNVSVIRDVISQSGISPESIAGISVTGHGNGLYLIDENGKPSYNGIYSTDTRANDIVSEWHENGVFDSVHPKIMQAIWAGQPVALLKWLKLNKPDVLSKTKWVLMCKDYIRYCLTGEAYAEITDLSGTNLMNVRDVKYDEDLLKEFGLESLFGKLPPIKYSSEICGYVTPEVAMQTGLKAGTPVAGGMFDIDACAIAMDISNEDKICVIAGTWSINEYISKEPVLNKSIMMNSLYCIPGYYLIEECSPTSASNYEWFIEMFLAEENKKAKELGINVFEYCNELADKVTSDEQNIIFLPYIFGSNYNPQAKASLIGLDSHHTRPQIIRAVLEGIVFCHMVHLEKLIANRTKTEAVRLAGGAANSIIWAQIFADVFKLPVEIVDTKELGTLGCAMAAAVGSGVYKDLKEAAQSMVKMKCRIEPNPANFSVYEKKFELYKKTSAALDGLWKDFN